MEELLLILISLLISYFTIYIAVRHAINDSKLVKLLEQNQSIYTKDEEQVEIVKGKVEKKDFLKKIQMIKRRFEYEQKHLYRTPL